ncbi:MAG: hypothetical protein NT040_01185 [Bacteroidetes bacterium]|nr:hypothetical protein [Bacteroidota bacterium]
MKKITPFLVFFLFFTIGAFAQVSISSDGSASDPSAMLDVKSTTKGLLLPRMTQAQRSAIASPVEGLVVLCTDCSESSGADLTVYLGGAWYLLDKQPQWSCGKPLTILHSADTVAPIDKLVSYGTITGIPGEPSKCWITRNLGASQQATSVSDATEASAGWYWKFNRKQGYRQDGTNLSPSWTTIAINEALDWQASNDPCTLELGTQWRIPTNTEWINVDGASGGYWANWTGPWSSGLKIHAAGYLQSSDGSLHNRGVDGHYWSSVRYSISIGYYLYFTSSYCGLSFDSKILGFSVRCLR